MGEKYNKKYRERQEVLTLWFRDMTREQLERVLRAAGDNVLEVQLSPIPARKYKKSDVTVDIGARRG